MITILRKEHLLIVSFKTPQQAISWAICGGGKKRVHTVAWVHATDKELTRSANPKEFLEHRLHENGIPEAVGMLTSADLNAYADIEKTGDEFSVRSIATVGMENALRVGDPARQEPVSMGTINLLCAISCPLSDEAHLEALSIAVEARTAAVLEAKIPSLQTGLPATGTGTDCIVITSPYTMDTPKSRIRAVYAGKHTVLGHLIGESVFEAVSSGLP